MKSKYYYKGDSLINYCKKNGYKYNNITKYISNEIKKYPNKEIQEIINEVMEKKRKTYTKYIVNGMNLSRLCTYYSISYDALSQELCRSKNNPKYAGMDETDRISSIIQRYLLGGEAKELRFDEPNTLILKPKKQD